MSILINSTKWIQQLPQFHQIQNLISTKGAQFVIHRSFSSIIGTVVIILIKGRSKGILGFVRVYQWHPLVTEHGARPRRLKLLKRHAFDLVLVHLALRRGGCSLDEPFVLALDFLLVDAVAATHLRVVSHLHRSRYHDQGGKTNDEQAGRHDDGDQQFRPRFVQVETCDD